MNDTTGTSTSEKVRAPTLRELISLRDAIYPQLRSTSAVRVHAKYSARQGAGGFRIEIVDAAGQCVKGIDMQLYTEVGGFVFGLVEMRYPQWHQDAGAHGHVDWDLKTDELQHQHRQRIEHVVTYDRSGL